MFEVRVGRAGAYGAGALEAQTSIEVHGPFFVRQDKQETGRKRKDTAGQRH